MTNFRILQTSISTCFYVYFIFINHLQESSELVIKSMSVPPLVKAGDVDYVILDCDYDLENTSSHGLVVKWYFNYDKLEYQWIYGDEPQTNPGTNYIDLEYKASDDPYTMYRALKLNNPTINLTGDYRCNVFTFAEEQIADASMIVYSTEEKFDLKSRKKIIDDNEGLEVTCSAEGLFPQPTMDISINNLPLNTTEKPDVTMRNDGKYDINIQVLLKNEDLPSEAEIKCTLAIPKANYTIPRELMYYPGTTTTPSIATNLQRKLEIQTINSSEPGSGHGGTASTFSINFALVILLILATVIH